MGAARRIEPVNSMTPETSRMPENHRVLVIGLDSATLDLIEPWANAGKLPTFARLMKNSAYGRLQSVMPVLSSAAWSSFMTGKNPGKHGLYDFVRREPGSYRLRVMRRDHIQSASLWNLLGGQGRKVGVLNVPMTYPPEEVNGFLVSGLGTPDYKTFTYPPELGLSLLERGYQVNKKRSYDPEHEDEYLAEMHHVAEGIQEAALWLLEKEAWDFFMVVFFDTDQVSHYFWRHMDKSHPQHEAARDARNTDAILKYYQRMDAYVDQLIRAAGQEVTVIILSDHGAGPLYRDVFLNEWLRQQGYLSIKREIVGHRGFHRVFARFGLTRENASKTLRSLRLGRVERWIKDRIGDRIELLPKSARAEFPQAIDWQNTRAYSFGYQGQIYINLRGREPLGSVDPGEAYERLCEEITQKLMELVDPQDGRRVVDQVLRREQIFHGPYLDFAPDLTLVMRNFAYITRQGYEFSDAPGRLFAMPAMHLSGGHRPQGILFISGPGAAEPGVRQGASLIDLAPTILHLLGCTLPDDLDGKVLEGWIRSPGDVQVRSMEGEDSEIPAPSAEQWSEEDEQEIVQRLKGLGYLE
jgi:predicted AlkP superfamily phosphohydrolase/phosphomutase